MHRQIISLAVATVLLSFAIALYKFTGADLVLRSAYFGLQASPLTVNQLLERELLYWWPFFALGAVCALAVNWASRRWAGTTQLADGVVTDRFGAVFKMYDKPFDHAPVYACLPITPAGLLPLLSDQEKSHCSDLELEILGALHASGAPADITDAHGVDLYAHSVLAWRIANDKEQGDTLIQLTAALHDAGKVMCYKRVSSEWVKTKTDHESLTNKFLRRLPGYIALSLDERRYLNVLAAAIAAPRTDGYPPEIAEAVSKVRMYDSMATGQEKMAVVKGLRDGEVDFADLLIATRRALREHDIFEKLNINRNARSAAATKAYYDQGSQLLVIQAQALRELVAQHVSEHNRSALSLRQPTQGFHPSYSFISASLEQQQALVTTVGLHESPSGLWALRSGQITWSHAFIMDANPLGHAVNTWGKSATEYTLTPVAS